MNNKSYDAVVFDMDGVIFDSERAAIEICIEVSANYNMPNIKKVCLACAGTNINKTRQIILDAYGTDFPVDKFLDESYHIYYQRFTAGQIPMKTGVVPLLDALQDADKKIALASSTHKELVTAQLQAAGILDYFQVIIGGDMVEGSKPAPDIYLKACEELGIRPDTAYAIEDSYAGIDSAYAAGMHPIMVPDLLPPTDDTRAKVDATLDTLLDVIEYL